jgi:hypothetical protein
MFYVTRYRFEAETLRFRRIESIGFTSRDTAEREARLDRAMLQANGRFDISVRITIRTAAGEHIAAPDFEAEGEYADRAALGRLTGLGGL